VLVWLCWQVIPNLAASDAPAIAGIQSSAAPGYWVTSYVVKGSPILSTNIVVPLLSRHTGANVSLEEIVKAASDLQAENRKQGYPMTGVAFAREQITNGVVTFNVFQTAVPQIVVSGQCYFRFTNNPVAVLSPAAPGQSSATSAVAQPAAPVIRPPSAPVTPAQLAEARAALIRKMSEVDAAEKDTRIHVVSTNTGPRFAVQKYLIQGNTVLPPVTMSRVLTNIDGAFGTNVSFDGIRTVVEQLQGAYRERGYVTVVVGLPQQKLTNETVKLQVTEGRLADINVTGNRYFSSNNVMRALPSLHTNMLLNGPVFQAELNRANGNQDRQIYPLVGPGPEPGTSDLTLKVKDQLPLHGKTELNNQSSPGTPDLRVNSSAVEDNLWQQEQSLGVQYGFSPEVYKREDQTMNFYDLPTVANYSAFYRLPLGNQEPVESLIDNNPDSFGYSEATRKFNLPPLSGRPDLTLIASRATIDSGLNTIANNTYTTSFTNNNQAYQESINEPTVHEDLTVNEDLGAHFSLPLQAYDSFQSVLSGGLDFKNYQVSSLETNTFIVNGEEIDYNTSPASSIPIHYTVNSPVPYTVKQIQYLPLTLRYDGNWRNAIGPATFGLGVNANLWFQSVTTQTATSTDTNGISHTTTTYLRGVDSLQEITGSEKSFGHWVVLNPSFSQQIMFYTNWVTTVRADGQWASEPLISNEQFGIGGVNSVRGYHEGEVFGDTGWHVSLEQQTPPHLVGIVDGNLPLIIRGSVYMDYATVYLLDPQSRQDRTDLWGAGFGLAASLGPHWQGNFLFSLPLIGTTATPRCQPLLNFSLTAQF
jgi:hemolysin activation/secretion protein